MSRDQRPGRVRVFTSGQTAEAPQRRRGDAQAPREAKDPVPVAQPIQAAIGGEAHKRGSMLGLAMLFIVGSALGGVLTVFLGMFEATL